MNFIELLIITLLIVLLCIVLVIIWGEIGIYLFHNNLCNYNEMQAIEIGNLYYCMDGVNLVDLKLIK